MQSVMTQIDCLHQVHLAPQRYLKMCTEVCRRREFSAKFMKVCPFFLVRSLKQFNVKKKVLKMQCSEVHVILILSDSCYTESDFIE